MRNVWWLALWLFLPVGALADSSYQSGSLCGAADGLQLPPPPTAACQGFRPTHAALVQYARDAMSTCNQSAGRFQAGKQSQGLACAPGPAAASNACGQASVKVEHDFSEIEQGLNAIKQRNEQPVMRSFPAQGQRISGTCLAVLDAYQQFAYDVTGAVNQSVKVVQGERAALRKKVSELLKSRPAAQP